VPSVGICRRPAFLFASIARRVEGCSRRPFSTRSRCSASISSASSRSVVLLILRSRLPSAVNHTTSFRLA
jgi:hypothetical protein